jgi:dihydroorotase
MEFDMAKNGTILRKCLWCSNDRFTIRKVVEKNDFRKNSFSIESHPIAEGSKANMSLFTRRKGVLPKASYQNQNSAFLNGNKREKFTES